MLSLQFFNLLSIEHTSEYTSISRNWNNLLKNNKSRWIILKIVQKVVFITITIVTFVLNKIFLKFLLLLHISFASSNRKVWRKWLVAYFPRLTNIFNSNTDRDDLRLAWDDLFNLWFRGLIRYKELRTNYKCSSWRNFVRK